MDARSLKRRLGIAEETIIAKKERFEDAEEEYEDEHRTFTAFSKRLEEKWEQRFDALAALAANAGVCSEDINAIRMQPWQAAATTESVSHQPEQQIGEQAAAGSSSSSEGAGNSEIADSSINLTTTADPAKRTESSDTGGPAKRLRSLGTTEMRSEPLAVSPLPPLPLPQPTNNLESFASLETNIFHLNPWIQSKKREKENHCFGPFIRASAVNFGAFPLTSTSAPLHASGAPYAQLRVVILEDLMNAAADPMSKRRYPDEYYRRTSDPDDFGLETLEMYAGNKRKASTEATQNALYYGKVRIGDYIIMRHCYANCKYLPNFLSSLPGGYPEGGVYVIGRVTGPIAIGSREDVEISKLLSRQIEKLWCRDFYPVTFAKLGKIADLDAATQKYLSKICVATMMQVFSPTGTTDASAARRHRQQLWRNATTKITPADFPEDYEIYRYGAAQQPVRDGLCGRRS